MAWTLAKVTALLDQTLKTGKFSDHSNNGLQVENSGRVGRICCGVDASLEFFEAAARRKADLVICHHGLSWGDSLKRITGLNRRLLSFLLEHDLALWACHLPLDAHPHLGNNARLAQALGVRARQPAFVYHGQKIGVRGVLPRPMTFPAFQKRVRQVVGNEIRCLDFGRAQVRTVGVVSGGAPSQIGEAVEMGLDVYLTGESSLYAYNLAIQEGINAVFAGHYATEKFGVQAVGERIRQRFGLPVAFVDMGIMY